MTVLTAVSLPDAADAAELHRQIDRAETYDRKRAAAAQAIARTRFTVLGSARLARWLGVRERILFELEDVVQCPNSDTTDRLRFRHAVWTGRAGYA